MKFKILIFLILLASLKTNAQFSQNEECLNHFNLKNKNKQLSKYILNFKQSKELNYIIPVKFRIIRNNKGESKITPSYLKELIQYLNYYYSINNTGIRFFLRPDIEFIDKSKLLNLRYYKQAPFQAFKGKSKDCINVIITNKLMKRKFLASKKKNYAGTYNSLFHTVIISQNTSTSTLSHEIGHFLGLKHPHRAWKYKWFQEPVSRTKKMPLSKKKMCECKGDGLCDTPAEPNLTKYTDSKCNYTGWNVKDRYGEVYKPNTHNIMSYTNNRECRNIFTKGQIAVMHYTLSKNKYSKFWRTDLKDNKKFFPDDFEPDNYKETATEIFFNTPQTHSFHIIYMDKNKKPVYDTEDWLYFTLKTLKKTNITLKISSVKSALPSLLISVYKDSKLIIEERTDDISEINSIRINNATAGNYFIKIKQVIKKEIVGKYKIIVIN